jgi:hypothetical protein
VHANTHDQIERLTGSLDTSQHADAATFVAMAPSLTL